MIELRFSLRDGDPDEWGDRLMEAGALSVGVDDADRDTVDEVPQFGEPGMETRMTAWRRCVLTALVADEAAAQALLANLAQAAGSATPGAGLPQLTGSAPVGERDWVRDTQAQFAPQSIGRLWIVPSWHTPPADAQAVLRLDPGVAFGTGSHPTTRLCLAWLEGRDLGGCRLLDYGCGSGILGIAALRLGAAAATATDIDPQALETAAQNARANGVALAVCAPDHLAGVAGGPFDIVVANILAVPLMVLAPVLAGLLRPGGTLLLSGILERQLEDVVAAYRASPAALTLEVAGVEDGWVALAGSAAAAG